jgi:nitroreductase/NAD-dependent dihydropyrimidine dehydrogenase PreA subunit
MIQVNTEICQQCQSCSDICPGLSFNNDMTGSYNECIGCQQCVSTCAHGAVQWAGFELTEQTKANISVEEFRRLISQRRSHRDFSHKTISRDVIESFIHHLRYSPTASNNQNLQFVVITDRTHIAELNNVVIEHLKKRFTRAINGITRPLLRLVYGTRMKSIEKVKSKFFRKAEKKHDMVTYNAPVVVIVHAPQTPTGMPSLNAGIWTGMALLYAEILGLSTCVNGYIVNAFDGNDKLKKRYGVPAKHSVFSAILLGYGRKKYHFTVQRNNPSIQWIE